MSLDWYQQLVILPILLPLVCGAALIVVNERRHRLKIGVSLASVLALLLVAIVLLIQADEGAWADGVGLYLAANWAGPFGILLAVDRLSAMMLVLTAVLGLCALLYSVSRWGRIGVHFHSLFQFLLMGLNGAFLTHDLFNLFVFFEVMLAASYGLLLHGYNVNRMRAGMQFVVVNLTASLVFLIGVALVYGASGTLNMADLAGRLASLGADDLQLLKLGGAILFIAFLVKAAVWPLCFWLPTTYAAASPPVAAMFVLMTKVGIYVILRLEMLLLSGGVLEGFGQDLLFWAGIATILFGLLGLLASEVHGQLAGYAAIVSSGTLLAAVSFGQPSLLAPTLFYLLSSTIALAAFMLLIELIDRSRNPIEAMLAVTKEAFEFEEAPDQPVGVGIPATLAFLGLSFAGCALVIAGVPPLAGFVAKFSLFHALLNPENGQISVAAASLMGLLLASGLATIIALSRYGVRTFWAAGMAPARLQILEVAPIAVLLLLSITLTVKAAPVLGYLERAQASLLAPEIYIDAVRSTPPVGSSEPRGEVAQ